LQRTLFPIAFGLSLLAWSPARAVDFTRDVQPIFSTHCVKCHGPEKQKSGYRVDDKAAAFRGGDSGKSAIVPSNAIASALVQRITTRNEDEMMPPKGERLASNEIAAVRAWIDSGAPWATELSTLNSQLSTRATHWSFQPIRRPAIPRVRNAKRVRNPIDRFVLARLERERIRPSLEADRATLMRRLYLDLLGLPPTPEQVDTFANDKRSDAYERLVDVLLASPHFGERWARHWLDLARYADSAGYQIDRVRPGAYLYRDWVIDSFNRDQPFDRFTIEQLAGDLLPNATLEQKIATGFHRMTLSNFEDGVDKAEFECKAKVDRVATTGTTWLGLTVGCAECHSHKYDPITQREFYQLYAFFNAADELDVAVPKVAEQAMLIVAKTNAAKTFVHVRGDFLNHGEDVAPGVLHALNCSIPCSSRRKEAHSAQSAIRNPQSAIKSLIASTATEPDRLDLAHWIVSPDNPLTARVAVNRIWLHLFGRGIVNTPEDFGTRGELPSHPELLDWLASEFQRNGWSRKQMIRLIVTSATYRQSSRMREELRSRDPENILLARQSRFRVESEIVRDLFLRASKLLQAEVGGPSIYPPIPEDVKAAGYGVGGEWIETQAPQKYRRGLYIANRRTVPYPVAMTFDQANANECTARRERSNTPLQPLALLNNPVFAECSAALAQRMEGAPGEVRDKLEFGVRICLSRKPARAELNRLEHLLREERKHARATEQQAWRAVADVLLTLDEFLTRE
jgi:hypothetical protein